MLLSVNGQDYLVTNWDEFAKSVFDRLSPVVEGAIVKNVRDQKLTVGGRLMRGYKVSSSSTGLLIENDAPYADYLEYGTFDYWKMYGLTSFPVPGYPVIPKKKELSSKQRRKLKLPKGGQPFAILRRVLYNELKMQELIRKAFR